MGAFLRLLAILLIASSSLQAQTVRLRLACLSEEYEEPVEVVKVGETFHLSLLATDLREPGTYVPLEGQYKGQERDLPRGVYATYCQVNHNPALTVGYRTTSITPLHRMLQYKNGYSADARLTDILSGTRIKIGALRGLGPGQGSEETEVCRLRMLAVKAGLQTFYITLDGLQYPLDETLVYQHMVRTSDPALDTRVKPTDIVTVPVSITIRPSR